MITRAEAEKIAATEDIGVIASLQIRQALTGQDGLNDATAKACLRALPVIERTIEALCPAVIDWDKHGGLVTAYGPLLEEPQAMIPLCVLANSRGDCFVVSVREEPPANYSEEWRALDMASAERRAAAWHEIDNAIHRQDGAIALNCVRVLTGPAGWGQLMAVVRDIIGRKLQPAVWVIAGSVGGRVGGALGVLALPPAISTVVQDMRNDDAWDDR
jgi:hypothetical protein